MGLKTKKKMRLSLGASVTLQFIVVAGVLLLANLLAANAQFTWDASEGKVHTLSPSTQAVLASLKAPVRVVAFLPKEGPAINDLLGEFRRACPSYFSYQVVNPEEDKALAKKYGAESSEAFIVEMGDKRRRVGAPKEQNFAGAILQLAKGGDKTVLFSEGHGESDMTAQDPQGYGRAAAQLAAAGYRTVQGPITDEALAKAKVLIIVGPGRDLTEDEAARVHKFVQDGGGLFVLLDPPPAAGLGGLLKPYGLSAAADYVVEPNGLYRHPQFGADTIFINAIFAKHPISERVTTAFLLPRVRSLGITREAFTTEEMVPLYMSSRESWGETKSQDRAPAPDRAAGHRGPRVLVVASGKEPSALAGKGRLLVIGTSRFAANRMFETAGNGEFWGVCVSWLAGDLDYPLIEEPVKKLTLNDAQMKTILIVCVLVLPGISAALGLLVFIRRAE